MLATAIAAIFLWLFVASVKTRAVPLRSLSPSLIAFALAAQFVFEGGLIAIVLVAMPALSKFSLRELGFRVPTAATLGVAAAGAVAMVIVSNGSASLIEYLAHSQHQQDVVEIFKSLHDRGAIVAFVLFAVVFAPIAEEILFRVFFFNLGMRFGGFWAGAIVSGALFGMAHGDVFAALPLAMGGAILCYVYYRTRNAWASMISHGIFNGLSIAVLILAPNLAS